MLQFLSASERGGSDKGEAKRAGRCLRFTSNGLPFLILFVYIALATLLFVLLQKYSHHVATAYATERFYAGRCADSGDVSFNKAFYFVTNVYTSIGYGDVVPCTWIGKLFTVVFACTSVPLTLLCLSRLGLLMARLANYTWRSLRTRLVRRTRAADAESGAAAAAEVDAAPSKLPLPVGVGVAALWIHISAFYFYRARTLELRKDEWDQWSWNYFDAIYFAVVSMLTIGFGDYRPPVRPLNVVTFAFIFVGLALVSMCVALATQRMETEFERVMAVIQDIYRQKRWRFGDAGEPSAADLTGAQQQIANVVLEMWKRDPSGCWLRPILEQAECDVQPLTDSQRQKAAASKWKRAAFHHDVASQVDERQLARASTHPSYSASP